MEVHLVNLGAEAFAFTLGTCDKDGKPFSLVSPPDVLDEKNPKDAVLENSVGHLRYSLAAARKVPPQLLAVLSAGVALSAQQPAAGEFPDSSDPHSPAAGGPDEDYSEDMQKNMEEVALDDCHLLEPPPATYRIVEKSWEAFLAPKDIDLRNFSGRKIAVGQLEREREEHEVEEQQQQECFTAGFSYRFWRAILQPRVALDKSAAEVFVYFALWEKMLDQEEQVAFDLRKSPSDLYGPENALRRRNSLLYAMCALLFGETTARDGGNLSEDKDLLISIGLPGHSAKINAARTLVLAFAEWYPYSCSACFCAPPVPRLRPPPRSETEKKLRTSVLLFAESPLPRDRGGDAVNNEEDDEAETSTSSSYEGALLDAPAECRMRHSDNLFNYVAGVSARVPWCAFLKPDVCRGLEDSLEVDHPYRDDDEHHVRAEASLSGKNDEVLAPADPDGSRTSASSSSSASRTSRSEDRSFFLCGSSSGDGLGHTRGGSFLLFAFRKFRNWSRAKIPLLLLSGKHPVTDAYLVSAPVLNFVRLRTLARIRRENVEIGSHLQEEIGSCGGGPPMRGVVGDEVPEVVAGAARAARGENTTSSGGATAGTGGSFISSEMESVTRTLDESRQSLFKLVYAKMSRRWSKTRAILDAIPLQSGNDEKSTLISGQLLARTWEVENNLYGLHPPYAADASAMAFFAAGQHADVMVPHVLFCCEFEEVFLATVRARAAELDILCLAGPGQGQEFWKSKSADAGSFRGHDDQQRRGRHTRHEYSGVPCSVLQHCVERGWLDAAQLCTDMMLAMAKFLVSLSESSESEFDPRKAATSVDAAFWKQRIRDAMRFATVCSTTMAEAEPQPAAHEDEAWLRITRRLLGIMNAHHLKTNAADANACKRIATKLDEIQNLLPAADGKGFVLFVRDLVDLLDVEGKHADMSRAASRAGGASASGSDGGKDQDHQAGRVVEQSNASASGLTQVFDESLDF